MVQKALNKKKKGIDPNRSGQDLGRRKMEEEND